MLSEAEQLLRSRTLLRKLPERSSGNPEGVQRSKVRERPVWLLLRKSLAALALPRLRARLGLEDGLTFSGAKVVVATRPMALGSGAAKLLAPFWLLLKQKLTGRSAA